MKRKRLKSWTLKKSAFAKKHCKTFLNLQIKQKLFSLKDFFLDFIYDISVVQVSMMSLLFKEFEIKN